MPGYEAANFDPPAPVAFVTVKSASAGIEIQNVPMLLDTGADVSLLPQSSVASLLTDDLDRYELQAFDGTISSAPSIRVEIQLLGKTFRGQFLVVDGWHGVLGRNILNNLSILFDGPSLKWLEQR
jgi:hypothetical protein